MIVVGYVRISRDEDRESYTSITAQKRIIEDYAKENDWNITEYYEDDNWSGYSFNRPAFKRLVNDIELGKIEVIIAKDLSRIGRHNANTLLFIEKLKALNVRLVLPNESGGYDIVKDENDMLGISTWFNEMYIKDISRKIRSSIKARQKEGKMLIKECFGYKRSANDKHMLVIDEHPAAIVEKVFDLYLEGNGYKKIAEYLNNADYPTPSQFIKEEYEAVGNYYKGTVCNKWSASQIQRIIKNDIYIGTLRLRKTKKNSIKGKTVKCDEAEQYIFHNNHEPIISQQDFALAKSIADNRSTNKYRGSKKNTNIFSGLLQCEDCGSYMIAYNKGGRNKYYICGNYHKNGSKVCSRHAVKEELLSKIVKEHISLLLRKAGVNFFNKDMEKNIKKQYNSLLADTLEEELVKRKNELKQLLNHKIIDISKEKETDNKRLIIESYEELEFEKKKQINYLVAQITEAKDRNSCKSNGYCSLEEAYEAIADKILCSRKHLGLIIRIITIDKAGHIKIRLKNSIEKII